jgi:predicted nucleic acid-binding protein
VFYRYLTGVPPELVDDIHRFIEDARKGERKIYASTIVLAEIRHAALRTKGFGTIEAFINDVRKGVLLIDPNPNIMIAAGRLKDCQSTNPSGDSRAKARVIGTADAIHLATCLHLRDTMGVKGIVFHTFDDGKGSTWEGRCVPLLSFEKWFPENGRPACIDEVCGLDRVKPLHPVPNLFSVQPPHGAPAHPHGRN